LTEHNILHPKTVIAALLVDGAILLPVSAFAEPVTLVCESANPRNGIGAWSFVVDVEAKIANNYTATITEQDVRWWDPRVEGYFTFDSRTSARTMSGGPKYICHLGHK
jgi:hypothetical protein